MSEANLESARILSLTDIADNRNILNRRLAKIGFERLKPTTALRYPFDRTKAL